MSLIALGEVDKQKIKRLIIIRTEVDTPMLAGANPQGFSANKDCITRVSDASQVYLHTISGSTTTNNVSCLLIHLITLPPLGPYSDDLAKEYMSAPQAAQMDRKGLTKSIQAY